MDFTQLTIIRKGEKLLLILISSEWGTNVITKSDSVEGVDKSKKIKI